MARMVSLIAGLAFGIVLLSEVFYYSSFDRFYPDSNRLYVVYENFKLDKSAEKFDTHGMVSGAVAPGLKAEVPGIEATTRLNPLGESVFYTDDLKPYHADFVLADENLPELLPRPMLSGNAEEILLTPMTCMISDKVAADMGGNVVGKLIELKEYPGKKLTIGGVFERLPENTVYSYDVAVSMVSISQFMWDGTSNWLGNDRYYSVVKLAPGIDPNTLAPAVRKMQEKYQDIEKLEAEQGGEVLKYTFEPIQKIKASEVKDMVIILTTIALSVLFVAILNYVLLSLSALVKRAKSSAIHKTCGAQASNLWQIIFSETLLLFVFSLLGAFLTIMAIKPFVEEQFGHSLASTLNPQVVWPLLAILLALLFFTAYLPGRFFAHIPVATAFRSYKQKRDKWKLTLLAVQFGGASFILTVLVIVSLQYNKLLEADHGYQTKNIYYSPSSGLQASKLPTVLHQLRTMAEVEQVGLGVQLPGDGISGNNVSLPGSDKELFNVADFYYIDNNFLSILNIPVTKGLAFGEADVLPYDMLISEKGEQMLNLNTGWTDGVLGKQVTVSEHGTTTIRGVFPDFVIRSAASADNRPSVFFYLPEEKFQALIEKHPSYAFNIIVKTNDSAQPGFMGRMAKVMNLGLPHQDAVVKSLEQEQRHKYQEQLGFRNAMMAGNVVILLVGVLGLLGYTANEAARRQKELAIRRINGARLPDILQLFIVELELVAVPAVLLGLGGAWLVAGRWMQNFAFKIALNWSIFLACSLVVLGMVALIAAVSYIRMANRNPVEALRYE